MPTTVTHSHYRLILPLGRVWQHPTGQGQPAGLLPTPFYTRSTWDLMHYSAGTKPEAEMVDHVQLGWVEVEVGKANHCDPQLLYILERSITPAERG